MSSGNMPHKTHTEGDEPMNTEPKKRTKKGRGRPVTYVVPQRIDASPEQIAEVVLLRNRKSTGGIRTSQRTRLKDDACSVSVHRYIIPVLSGLIWNASQTH